MGLLLSRGLDGKASHRCEPGPPQDSAAKALSVDSQWQERGGIGKGNGISPGTTPGQCRSTNPDTGHQEQSLHGSPGAAARRRASDAASPGRLLWRLGEDRFKAIAKPDVPAGKSLQEAVRRTADPPTGDYARYMSELREEWAPWWRWTPASSSPTSTQAIRITSALRLSSRGSAGSRSGPARQPHGGAGQGRLRTVGWSRLRPQRVLVVVAIQHPPHPAALAHCAAGPSGPRLPARAHALPVGWRRSDTFTTTYDRLRLPSVP
jgi:hypothetical protein